MASNTKMGTSHIENEATRTIRELGGEFWAELSSRIDDDELNWRSKNKLVDILMGILARHQGKVIANDKDLPVAPLETLE